MGDVPNARTRGNTSLKENCMAFWDVVTDIIPGRFDDFLAEKAGLIGNGNDNPRFDIPSGGSNQGRRNNLPIQPAFFGTDLDGTTDWNPFADADDVPQQTMNMNTGVMNVIVAPSVTQRLKAPRGYVIVEYNGQKVAMLKEIARKCGYWKPQAKPIMTAAEGKCLRRAARLTKKVDRIAKMSNAVVGQAPLRRVRPGKR